MAWGRDLNFLHDGKINSRRDRPSKDPLVAPPGSSWLFLTPCSSWLPLEEKQVRALFFGVVYLAVQDEQGDATSENILWSKS